MSATKSEYLSGWMGFISQAENLVKAKPAQGELPLFRIGPKPQTYENQPERLSFGAQHAITRHLMDDCGVKFAIEEYRRRGGVNMLGDDAFYYIPKRKAFKDYLEMLLLDEWAGAFLGGYQVEIRNLAGDQGERRVIEISVSGLPLLTNAADNLSDRVGGGPRGRQLEDAHFFWIEELDLERADD